MDIIPWTESQFWFNTFHWGWPFLLYVFGLIAAIDAIWNGRTSQGTLAWVTALTFIPFIALPLYLFFGSRKFHGYKKARKVGKQALRLVNLQQDFSNQAATKLKTSDKKSNLVLPLEALSRLPQSEQNQVQLLINGEQTFTHIFQAIETAQSSILVQFYIINDDQLGRRLQQALINKAQQGVKVYLLYDEIGSSNLKQQFINELRLHNVHCSRFNRFQFMRRLQINFRNHRKLIIIDGKTCFIGGHNIGDEYLRQDSELGIWRDTHLQIDGPASIAAQLSFVEDWYWAQKQLPPLSWQPQTSNDNTKVLIVPGGPADDIETMSLSFVHLIQQAQHSIWLATPYFIPDLKVMGALQLAALKGLEIRILLPEQTDNRLIAWATRSYVNELRQLGIEFFQYQAGFMHQKVMLTDQKFSYIGSANLDNRSLRINFELNALVESKEFAEQVQQMLIDDFKHSTPYPLQAGILTQLATKAARLLSPIL